MLRPTSLPVLVVPAAYSNMSGLWEVIRALQEHRTGSCIQVVGRRDQEDSDATEFLLDVYVRHGTKPSAGAAPAVTLLPFTRIFSRKCSWTALRRLRADALAAIRKGAQSEQQRKELTEFLVHCFERPAIFARAWNGVMVLNVKRVTHFVNTLLQLACSAPTANNGDDYTNDLIAALSAFLVPELKKSE